MYITEELTLFEFAERFLNLNDMETPVNLDIEELGIEIESYDLKTKKNVFKPLTNFIVKNKVDSHYKLDDLLGSSAHKVLYDNEFIALESHPYAKIVDKELCIVDVTVQDTHNYVANGHVNHNTVPGGKIVVAPFVRT